MTGSEPGYKNTTYEARQGLNTTCLASSQFTQQYTRCSTWKNSVLIIPPLFLTAETRFFQGLAPIFSAEDILKLALFTLTNKNYCFSGNCWEVHSLETENEIRISRNPALNFLTAFLLISYIMSIEAALKDSAIHIFRFAEVVRR